MSRGDEYVNAVFENVKSSVEKFSLQECIIAEEMMVCRLDNGRTGMGQAVAASVAEPLPVPEEVDEVWHSYVYVRRPVVRLPIDCGESHACYDADTEASAEVQKIREVPTMDKE